MTEIALEPPCKPVICEIRDCIIDCINSATDYTVNNACGKEEVTVDVYFGNIQPAPGTQKKFGGCATGRRMTTQIFIEIEVRKCSTQSCEAGIAHQAIQNAICNSGCCIQYIEYQGTEPQMDRKSKTEIWTDTYAIIYNDPEAK